MSSSRWVITPSQLFWSLTSFLYSFSMYSCYLFLISSASIRSIKFLFFIVPLFAWNVPLLSPITSRELWSFLFYCFLQFLCTVHIGMLSYLSLPFFGILHSDGCVFPFLLCLLLLFFSQLFVRTPQTAILPVLHFFSWGWSWSLSPVQCHESLFIVHQALCLSDLVP